MLLKQQKVNGDLLYTETYKTDILVQEGEKEVEEDIDVHTP
jgi:hypothetical protein